MLFISAGIGNYYFMAHISGFTQNVTGGNIFIFDVELVNDDGYYYYPSTGAYTGKFKKIHTIGDNITIDNQMCNPTVQ